MIKLMMISTAAAVLAAAQPISAQDSSEPLDEDTIILEPSTEWRLREMDDRCRLSRRFGEGENRTTLWLDQGGAEPFYNLTMIGRPFRHLYGQFTQVQFGPEEASSIRGYINAKSSTGRPVMMMHGVELAPKTRDPDNELQPTEPLADERVESIEYLHIHRAVKDPVRFQLGPLNEKLDQLQICATILGAKLTLAGMMTSEKSRAARPIEEETWAEHIRYPSYLARAGVVGIITIRLTVSKEGKAVNCQITGSNSPQVFDDEVCFGLMKNARFEPALDENGEPTNSYYTTAVEFRFK